MRKVIIGGIIVVVVGGLLLTLIALLLETNPPVVSEPAWDSPQTRDLAVRACFDCHSNQTRWPWFTRMPVGSWIAALDTFRGRRELNFSEYRDNGNNTRLAGRLERSVQDGEMPPALYLPLHPDANLSDTEKQQLISGFQATFK